MPFLPLPGAGILAVLPDMRQGLNGSIAKLVAHGTSPRAGVQRPLRGLSVYRSFSPSSAPSVYHCRPQGRRGPQRPAICQRPGEAPAPRRPGRPSADRAPHLVRGHADRAERAEGGGGRQNPHTPPTRRHHRHSPRHRTSPPTTQRPRPRRGRTEGHADANAPNPAHGTSPQEGNPRRR